MNERAVEGKREDIQYYWSNLPAHLTLVQPYMPLAQLAASARTWWPIEQFYEDAKQAFGRFYRHVALGMLSYSFLVQQHMTEPEPAARPFPLQYNALYCHRPTMQLFYGSFKI